MIELGEEFLRQEKAFESLTAFRAYMAPTGLVDFQHIPARHHQIIIAALERLEHGAISKLLILAPPGSAKSTYCSVQFPLWYLARHPDQQILCVSNTEGLAENFSRRRLAGALTQSWSVLAETELDPKAQAINHPQTLLGGGIKIAGVGGSIVGFRSSLNVLDDPISKQEDALNPAALDKQWDWYVNEYRTRLKPGSPELVISTRWAKNDIAGHLLREEPEQWTVLRLPMLADRDDDPLGRAMGEPLWPEYFTPEHIADKQKHPFLWSTQFQQQPLDVSGSWVDLEHIKIEPSAPKKLNHVIAVDLALTVGKGDYTVMIVAGIDTERNIHIVDVYRGRISPDVTRDKLFALCDQYEPSEVLIDDDNASKTFTRLLYGIARIDGKIIPWRPQPMRGQNKEVRAAAIRGLLLGGIVKFVRAKWNGDVFAEMLDFPSGAHDDVVDTLGLIGRRYGSLYNPTEEGLKPKDPYEGMMVRVLPSGKTVTTKTMDDMWADRAGVIAGRRGRI
jgi:predicted phage terminase large subunit-like protein